MSNAPFGNTKHDFLPAREADLLAWSLNFNDLINTPPGPGIFGLTPAQATAYTALHDAYATAYTRAVNPSTNTRSSIVAKNDAKKALKAYARMLARLVRATPEVTNGQRGELGLTVPDPDLTPVQRPSDPPVVSILPSMGRTVRIRLRDKAEPMRKGKSPGVAGAAVLSYVGDEPPQRMAEWTFHGNATRRFFDVRFDVQVPPGAKAWIVAMWFNTRGEFGPASAMQCTRIGEGIGSFAMAA